MQYKFSNRAEFDMALDAAAGTETQGDPDPVLWHKSQEIKTDENYKIAVMWHDACFDPTRLAAFKRLFKEEFGLAHDIRWIGEVITFKTPGVPDTGGRHDVAFLVHEDDIPKISVTHRLELGFRWFWDVIGNGDSRLYPLHFRRAYT